MPLLEAPPAVGPSVLARTGVVVNARDQVEWLCRECPEGPPVFALHEDEEDEWAALDGYEKTVIKSLTTALEVTSKDVLRTAKVCRFILALSLCHKF